MTPLPQTLSTGKQEPNVYSEYMVFEKLGHWGMTMPKAKWTLEVISCSEHESMQSTLAVNY